MIHGISTADSLPMNWPLTVGRRKEHGMKRKLEKRRGENLERMVKIETSAG